MREPRRRPLVALAITLLGATWVGTANAATPTPWQPQPQLVSPTGSFRDPAGDLWVADEAGVCRVTMPTPINPTSQLLASRFCDPTLVGAIPPGFTTLRDARPVAPMQMAYLPGANPERMFFVADGSSKGGAIWRMRLIPDGAGHYKVDEAAGQTEMIFDSAFAGQPTDRYFGLAYKAADNGGTGNSPAALAFSNARRAAIERIDDPETCTTNVGVINPTPTTCQFGAVFGFARLAAAPNLAFVGQDLYIADLGLDPVGAPIGVTRLTPASGTAAPVPGLGGIQPTALTYDASVTNLPGDPHPGARLYVGTMNPGATQDAVHVYLPGPGTLMRDYVTGLTAVTTIALSANDDIDVIQDRCLKTTCEDVGKGAMFHVPFDLLGPAPTVSGPPAVTRAGSATFTFSFTDPGVTVNFFCSLDNATPAPCGSSPGGSITYGSLGDGIHTFRLLASPTTMAPTVGLVATTSWKIDRTPPVIAFTGTSFGAGTADVAYAVSKNTVDVVCALDGAAFAPCFNPARFTGLVPGPHSVTVRATDFIGNSASATTTFVQPTPPPPLVLPTNVTVVTTSVVTPPAPRPTRVTLRGRALRVTVDVPGGVRYLRAVVWSSRRPSLGRVTTRTAGVVPGHRADVTFLLPPALAKRFAATGAVSVNVMSGPAAKMLTNRERSKVTIVKLTRKGASA